MAAHRPPAAADLDTLRRLLRREVDFSDDDLAVVEPVVTVRSLARGDHLLRAGDVARDSGVVVAGLLREYFTLPDGDERTRGFAIAGDYVGSLADLLRGGGSRSLVVAEEPSELLVLPWAEIRAATAGRPRWAGFAHVITQRLYLLKSEREYELLGLDAEARYLAFRERYPGLEARVTQRHVASYLGVTPEHLSRLRGRRRRDRAAGRSS